MRFNVRRNRNVCVYGPPEMIRQLNEQREKEEKNTRRHDIDGDIKIVIVGMGAMGILYAERLKSIKPCDVTFLMDEARYERNRDKEIKVNGVTQHFEMATPDTYPTWEPADIVIVATKATALNDAMDLMDCCMGPDTIIVSLLNGITSEEILSARFGGKNVIPCVAQGMDAVKIGDELVYSSDGTLFLGKVEETDPEAFTELTEVFDEYGVNWTYAEDIMLRMWKKFMLNCGINQACMVHQATYGTAVIPGTDAYNTFVDSMLEVRELASKEGYEITDKDIKYYIDLMATLNYDGMPSMAQDRINRKHSEVESFAGTVIKLAKKHGMNVPVNKWIYGRVAEIEAEY